MGRGIIDNFDDQAGDDLHMTTYMAINLIWNPLERIYVGAEYLHGSREDKDGSRGEANRLQASFVYFLP